MYDKEDGTFHYHPGAVMCNLFLADEINRTSAKTQAALLEVMEEGAVTVDGVTYPVPEPFQVIATENPIGSVGTQMLPESQLDRFMICVVMGYPSRRDEIEILTGNAGYPSLREMEPVITADDLIRMQAETREVFISGRGNQKSPYACAGIKPPWFSCSSADGESRGIYERTYFCRAG